jgi:mutator protein MutT
VKNIRVVAAVICDSFERKSRIFATARGYGELKGGWEFPGGKIEAGETPQEAVVREIREELETTVRVGEMIDTIEYDYPTFHLSMDCFWCEVVQGDLKLLEAEAARWLTKDELDSVNWLPADITLIEKIREEMERAAHADSAKTLEYYNKNAEGFIANTVNAQISVIHEKFMERMPQGSYILDFGCGSGRDTKLFLEKGYRVDATDGSERLCEAASEYTGIKVRKMLFAELDSYEEYDGIWACSSILHLPKGELRDVFKKMIRAVKPGGIIYTSFKYGESAGMRNGRYFTDFTGKTFADFITDFPELSLEEEWVSADVRPGRGDEKWLNLILKKADKSA